MRMLSLFCFTSLSLARGSEHIATAAAATVAQIVSSSELTSPSEALIVPMMAHDNGDEEILSSSGALTVPVMARDNGDEEAVSSPGALAVPTMARDNGDEEIASSSETLTAPMMARSIGDEEAALALTVPMVDGSSNTSLRAPFIGSGNWGTCNNYGCSAYACT